MGSIKKTFLICSLGGRIKGVMKLLTSLSEYAQGGWHLDLVLQRYPKEERAIIGFHAEKIFGENVNIFETNQMTGPHLARCIALDNDYSDVWCILDDDMFAVSGKTDYDKMADILMQNDSIGLLSSNWRRTEGMLEKLDPQDKLIKQNIVYTGGGMMFREAVADIIRAIPRTQYLFDNPLWSIYSYVNGYDNMRYMGSAAVHEICTKGGRHKWIDESDSGKALPPSAWLRTREGNGTSKYNKYLICDSTDITSLAHELHEKNRRINV